MNITLNELQTLAELLPPFDLTNPDKLEPSSGLAQAYLNYYHINFALEGLCVRHNLGYMTSAGFDIAVHQWLPESPRGTVFLIHGFTDHVGLFQHPIRFLLQHNWAVVALDLPGHGLSSGEQASIGSFNQYRVVIEDCLQQCEKLSPQPWLGMGQSTGGAVLLNLLVHCESAPPLERLLLLAPLVRPTGWPLGGWLLPTVRRFRSHLPRRFGHSSHDTQFCQFLRHRDPLQTRTTPLQWAAAMQEWIDAFAESEPWQLPLTIVQGTADKTVDFRFNLQEICRKFPTAEVLTIEDARHHLVNETEPYRNQLLEFMGKWLR